MAVRQNVHSFGEHQEAVVDGDEFSANCSHHPLVALREFLQFALRFPGQVHVHVHRCRFARWEKREAEDLARKPGPMGSGRPLGRQNQLVDAAAMPHSDDHEAAQADRSLSCPIPSNS